MAPDIQLGDVAEDMITGFRGVVTSRTEWLNGCWRLGLQPQKLTKDGGLQEAQVFDSEQLKLITAKKHKAKKETGGPRPTISAQPAIRR